MDVNHINNYSTRLTPNTDNFATNPYADSSQQGTNAGAQTESNPRFLDFGSNPQQNDNRPQNIDAAFSSTGVKSINFLDGNSESQNTNQLPQGESFQPVQSSEQMMQVMQMLQILINSLMNMINSSGATPEQASNESQSTPQSSAPQSSTPQSSAPQSSAPQSSAPQSSAPQSSAPQSASPSSSNSSLSSNGSSEAVEPDESPTIDSANSTEKVSDFMKPDSDEEFEPSGADYDAANDVMWVAGDQGELRAYNRDGSYTASEITGEDFEGVTIGENGQVHVLAESTGENDPTKIVTYEMVDGEIKKSSSPDLELNGLPESASYTNEEGKSRVAGAESIEYIGDGNFLVGHQSKDEEGKNLFLVDGTTGEVKQSYDSGLEQVGGLDYDAATGTLTMLDTIENEGGGEHTNWQTTAQLSGTTLSGLTDKSVLEGQTGQLEGLASMGDGSRFFADDQGSMFFNKASS